MKRPENEGHPIYIVPNIEEVPHWKDVRGPFNFYAGVPITTPSGYNIGTLFAFSARPRPDLEPEEKLIMVRIAKQVMSHLELELRVLERSRLLDMNRCLAEFGATRKTSSSSVGWLDQTRLETSSRPSLDTRPSASIVPGEAIYPRAARLLRTGLGCTGVALLATDRNRVMRTTSSPNGNRSFQLENRRSSVDSHAASAGSSNSRVLAYASAEPDCDRLLTLPNDLLLTLIELYPEGKVFHFDTAGNLVPSMGASNASTDGETNDSQSVEDEKSSGIHPALALRRCLPESRQIILTSMLDPRKDNFSVAAIAWSDGWERLYTGEFDLPYLASFCMTAIAMVLHEEAIVANKQKADFIGSISHELRSPLHGILASTELLRDTHCDPTQQYLMASVQSCGRVLLGTIDHVLDFGKFTSIESKSKRPQLQSSSNVGQSKTGSSRSETTTDGQLLNRPVAIDLAALCEEVIDSVLLGRTYHDALAPMNDFDPSSNKPPPNQIRPVISLNIMKRDWRFVSQPGAIQRIIMNLFGNALKYTPDGYITVKIEAEDLETEQPEPQDALADGEGSSPGTTIAKIKVSDSGRGMSQDFIQSRLWTPFAQEDQTSQGTGLGLSITKRVVNILGGDIDLQSKLGVGTTFTVQLPFRKLVTPDEGPQTNQNQMPDVVSDVSLREQLRGKVFIIYEPYSTSGSTERVAGIIHAHESLLTYMQDWFGLTLMREPGTPVDLVVVDESVSWSHTSPDTDIFLSEKPRIVLSANPTTKLGELQPGGCRETTVYVTKPVAPRKLGRALRHLLPHLLETTKSKDATPTSRSVSPPTGSEPVTSHSPDDAESDVRLKETSSNNAELASQKRITALEAELERLRSLLHEMRPTTGGASGQTPNGIHHSDESEVAPEMNHESETPATPGTAQIMQKLTSKPAHDGLPRILLVDDNAINLRVLTMYLRKAGIPDSKTVSVSSGEDAVAQFVRASIQGPPFDIVLMDLSMPGMDGFDATREIRAFEDNGGGVHEKALVVALTGLVSERDRDRALEAGVNQYFIKPFSGKKVDELLAYWKESQHVDIP